MTDKEQTEEIKNLLEKTYKEYGLFIPLAYARVLSDEGYHKTIWHKVADGDFPVSGEVVRVVLEWLGVMYYVQGVYTEGYGWTFTDNPNPDAEVLAWTELPRYKE